MNIFLICGSPGRTNGHLCPSISTISGTDGGAGAIGAGVDSGMAIDLDARCGAARFRRNKRTTAANGRTSMGSCRHIGMPPDDDVFCISTSTTPTTAANAGTVLASGRIDRCITLNNDILCTLAADSTDGCAAITANGFGGQDAGAVCFCRSYFFSPVVRLVRNGQPALSVILVQTC